MGAVNSCFIPRHHHDEPKEDNYSRSKFKGHRRNLSATFNLSIAEDDADTESQSFVNINTATEEELMTLPGINRPIAKNIIDYRRKIGGYRKVEDLALVSGVGAERLSRIRCDICTGSRNTPGSRDSSLHGSRVDGESVREKNGRGANAQPLVNVNTVNMFQLIKIKGVGMGLAENIVTYREKNGPFQSLDDLVKVKGIGVGILSAIRPYLCLDSSSEVPSSLTSPNSPTSPAPTPSPDPVPVQNGKAVGGEGDTKAILPAIPRHGGDDQCHPATASIENLLQLWGPLLEAPKRPSLSEPFKFRHKNRRVVRVATWNLEQCSLDKIMNPGVKEVVCMTVLENG